MNDIEEPRPKFWTLTRRRWAYSIAVAAGGVAIAYGLASSEQVAALLVLGAALFGVSGMALANPTQD